MDPSLALAVPNADRDGAKPSNRSMYPRSQNIEWRAGQQLWAGETQGPLGRGSGRGTVFQAAKMARR